MDFRRRERHAWRLHLEVGLGATFAPSWLLISFPICPIPMAPYLARVPGVHLVFRLPCMSGHR